jgi:hypothetical protein
MSRHRLWIPVLALLAAGAAAADPEAWLRPKSDYAADTVMETDAGRIEGRVWASGDKERRELVVDGRRHVVILRRDRGVSWILLPEQRMYLENGPGEGPLAVERPDARKLEREALGEESVNGIPATKYRVHGRTADGAVFEGAMWLTAQEIPVRVLTQQGGAPMRMELRNLSLGAVDPARFEIPPGFHRFDLPAPAKAELEALRAR